VVVVQGGEELGQRHHGVRGRPAEDAGVQRVLERGHSNDARDVAAQGHGQDGFSHVQIAHVANDEEVGLEELGVRLDERLQGPLRLLHALEDEPHGARWAPVEEPHRAQMADETALVVGCTSPVDTPSAMLVAVQGSLLHPCSGGAGCTS
jgi:hypothetical protein